MAHNDAADAQGFQFEDLFAIPSGIPSGPPLADFETPSLEVLRAGFSGGRDAYGSPLEEEFVFRYKDTGAVVEPGAACFLVIDYTGTVGLGPGVMQVLYAGAAQAQRAIGLMAYQPDNGTYPHKLLLPVDNLGEYFFTTRIPDDKTQMAFFEHRRFPRQLFRERGRGAELAPSPAVNMPDTPRSRVSEWSYQPHAAPPPPTHGAPPATPPQATRPNPGPHARTSHDTGKAPRDSHPGNRHTQQDAPPFRQQAEHGGQRYTSFDDSHDFRAPPPRPHARPSQFESPEPRQPDAHSREISQSLRANSEALQLLAAAHNDSCSFRALRNEWEGELAALGDLLASKGGPQKIIDGMDARVRGILEAAMPKKVEDLQEVAALFRLFELAARARDATAVTDAKAILLMRLGHPDWRELNLIARHHATPGSDARKRADRTNRADIDKSAVIKPEAVGSKHVF